MAQTPIIDPDIRFRDGLGLRVVTTDASGDGVEQLRLSNEVAVQEASIRERVGRLVNFRHVKYVRLRGVERLKQGGKELVVSYDAVEGDRLATILESAGKIPLTLDVDVALQIVRDLLPGIGILHDSRKVTHGAIGPERLAYTTQHRLIILDHGLGLALGRLNQPRKRLWEQYRIAVPGSARGVFDERTDVIQIGVVALSVLLARPLTDDEYPGQLKRLILSVKEHTKHGARPVSPELRQWLERTLPVDDEHPFRTVRDAQEAFEALVTKGRYAPSAAAVKAFLTRYRGAMASSIEAPPAAEPAAPVREARGARGNEVDRALEEFAITIGPKAPISRSKATPAIVESPAAPFVAVELPVVAQTPVSREPARPAEAAETVVIASAIEGHAAAQRPDAAPASATPAAEAPRARTTRRSDRLSESPQGRERVGDAIRRARQSPLRSDLSRPAAVPADGKAGQPTVDAPRKTRGRLDALRALEEELSRLAALDLVMPRHPVAPAQPVAEALSIAGAQVPLAVIAEALEAEAAETMAREETEADERAAEVAAHARVSAVEIAPVEAAAVEIAAVETAAVKAGSTVNETPLAAPSSTTERAEARPFRTDAIDAELAMLMGERDADECATPIWTIDGADSVAATPVADSSALALDAPVAAADRVIELSVVTAHIAQAASEPAPAGALAQGELPADALEAIEALAAFEAAAAANADAVTFEAASDAAPEAAFAALIATTAEGAIEAVAAPAFELTAPCGAPAALVDSFELTAPIAEERHEIERPMLLELSAFEQAAADIYAAAAQVRQPGRLFEAEIAASSAPVAPEPEQTASVQPVAEAPLAATDIVNADTPLVESVDVVFAVAETAVAEIAMADTVIAEPVVSEPGVAELAIAETAIAETVFAETAVAETAIAETAIAEPAAIDSPIPAAAAIAETAVVEPVIAEATIAEIASVEPAIVEVAIVEAALAEPAIVEPVVAEAAIAQVAIQNIAIEETAIAQTAAVETAIAEIAIVETAIVETAIAETAIAETAMAQTATAETATVEFAGLPPAAALEIAAVETPAVETARLVVVTPVAAAPESAAPKVAAAESAALDAAPLDLAAIEIAPLETSNAESVAPSQTLIADEATVFDTPARRASSFRERVRGFLGGAFRKSDAETPADMPVEAAPLAVEALPAEAVAAPSLEEHLDAALPIDVAFESFDRVNVVASHSIPAVDQAPVAAAVPVVKAPSAEPVAAAASQPEPMPTANLREAPHAVPAAPAPVVASETSRSKRKRSRKRNKRRPEVVAPVQQTTASQVSALPVSAPAVSVPIASEPVLVAPAASAEAAPEPTAMPGQTVDRVAFFEFDASQVPDAVPAWARGTAGASDAQADASDLQGIGAVQFETGSTGEQPASDLMRAAWQTRTDAPADESLPYAAQPSASVAPPSNVVPFQTQAEREALRDAAAVAPRRRSLISRINWGRTLAASLVLAMLEGVAFAAAWWYVTPTELGWLVVHTRPAGIEISIDGMSRGQTPFAVSLRPGRHTIELRQGTAARVIPVEISAGVQTEQRITWGNAFKTGQARVTSAPDGAHVFIDGKSHGSTPLTVSELSAGKHTVTVEASTGTVTSSLIIEAGETTELDVPVYSGWVSVLSPVELEIFESGRLIGTTEADKIMLAAGKYKLDFKSESLGYEGTQTVEVRPGATTAVSILPTAPVSVEGPVGVELFVDGERAGVLPIDKLKTPIGTREFVFKRPGQDERRQVVVVTMTNPTVVKYQTP